MNFLQFLMGFLQVLRYFPGFLRDFPKVTLQGKVHLHDGERMRTQCERNAIKEIKVNKINKKENNIKEKFEVFWKAYPKKRNKGQAEKSFEKVAPDEQLMTVMVTAIEQAKKSAQWLKDGGQYIPYPATWLNAKGWEDEINEKGGDDGANRQHPEESGTYKASITRPFR